MFWSRFWRPSGRSRRAAARAYIRAWICTGGDYIYIYMVIYIYIFNVSYVGFGALGSFGSFASFGGPGSRTRKSSRKLSNARDNSIKLCCTGTVFAAQGTAFLLHFWRILVKFRWMLEDCDRFWWNFGGFWWNFRGCW